MCTYNGARHIEMQLASILSQSRRPDELVVSDDGSTDGTQNLIERMALTSATPIHLLHGGDNLGVTRNFERAISACKGDLIFLADQDDIWEREKVSIIVGSFLSNPACGYVFSDANLLDDNGDALPGTLWHRIGLADERLQRYKQGQQIRMLLNGGNFVYGMTMAFRASYLTMIMPIVATSANCTHDTWIALVLSGAGHGGIALECPLVQYRQHSTQVVGAGAPAQSRFRAAYSSIRSTRKFDPELPTDLIQIASRLSQAAGLNPDAITAASLLKQKALHLRNRQRASTSKLWLRLQLVASEIRSGRYSVFSNSLKTALRDLIA
jgi:hypothetical protein